MTDTLDPENAPENDTFSEENTSEPNEAASADEPTEAGAAAEDGSEAEADEKAEEIEAQPDNQDVIVELKRLDVRLDVNEQGNVYRAFFYLENGLDENMGHLWGLPSLKELWLVGTRVSPAKVAELREQMPNVTIYR